MIVAGHSCVRTDDRGDLLICRRPWNRIGGIGRFCSEECGVSLARLSNGQLHAYAAYCAAAEAVLKTRLSVRVVDQDRRCRLNVYGKLVQMFSKRSTEWQLTGAPSPLVSNAVAVVFVDFAGKEPRYYVVPAQTLKEDVDRRYKADLAAKADVRPSWGVATISCSRRIWSNGLASGACSAARAEVLHWSFRGQSIDQAFVFCGNSAVRHGYGCSESNPASVAARHPHPGQRRDQPAGVESQALVVVV